MGSEFGGIEGRGQMPQFEIGMVYRKNSRLHLAVNHHTLITVDRGKCRKVKPYVKYEPIRHISVEELCLRWKITTDALDTMTEYFLERPAPDPRRRSFTKKNGLSGCGRVLQTSA